MRTGYISSWVWRARRFRVALVILWLLIILVRKVRAEQGHENAAKRHDHVDNDHAFWAEWIIKQEWLTKVAPKLTSNRALVNGRLSRLDFFAYSTRRTPCNSPYCPCNGATWRRKSRMYPRGDTWNVIKSAVPSEPRNYDKQVQLIFSPIFRLKKRVLLIDCQRVN